MANAKQKGVHLQVLLDIDRRFPDLTTEEICREYIKPETVVLKCALIQLLESDILPNGLRAVGPASCFVSHAWKCKFSDVLDCLRQHNAKHPNTYFWFDLVTNNQHQATAYPFAWWCSTFKESIRGIGRVLLVMTPWSDPIPLKRAWCLFEVFSTIDVQASMHIAIPSSQTPAFKAAVKDDFDAIMDVLVALDGRKAEATNPADKIQIFEVVETQIPGELAEQSQDGNLLYNVAIIARRDFGDSNTCLALLEKCLAIKLATVGENHPDTASTYQAMGHAYRSRGNYEKSLHLHEKELAITLATLGEHHLSTASTYNAMGIAYKSIGDYDRALQFHEKELAIHLGSLGETHPNTARTLNAMGQAYEGKGDYDTARLFHEKELAIILATLGENHPNFAITNNAIGIVCQKKGDKAQALLHYTKACAVFEATLGAEHPHTVMARRNLSNLTEESDASPGIATA